MLSRLCQSLKSSFQRLFGGKRTSSKTVTNLPKQPPPPLNDTDIEFLFTELLEGVHQARGQAWALKWLQNIEHRISQEAWVDWLRRFGDRLLSSPAPNNELASRLVELGELEIGEIGDIAYDIGMQLLRRSQGEPIWEYDGPDALPIEPLSQQNSMEPVQSEEVENAPQGESQTFTIDELSVMLQHDENLRQQIAQQLGIQTDDPQIIIQELINQFYPAEQSNADETE